MVMSIGVHSSFGTIMMLAMPASWGKPGKQIGSLLDAIEQVVLR
jgi:hypothetical protein